MASDPEVPDRPLRQWSWKKIICWFLVGLVIVVVTIVAYDEKPEPYDDLMPITIVPDAKSNGYLLLQERWENLPQADPQDCDRMRDMVWAKMPWDDALVAKMRVDREQIIPDLREALALPQYLVPLPGSLKELTASWIARPLMILAMEALHRARAGAPAEAVRIVRDLKDLSVLQIQGSQHLFPQLIGLTMNSVVAQLTCELMDLDTLDSVQLAALAQIWEEDIPAHSALQSVLQGEAALLRKQIGAVESSDPWPEAYQPSAIDSFFFNKNQTLNRLHRELRQIGHVAFRPFPSEAAAEQAGWRGPPETPRKLWATLDPNRAGNRLLEKSAEEAVYTSLYKILPGLTNKMLFQPPAIRLNVALHRWRSTRPGQWPVSLDELVPDYLPAVPLDPYNGEALRWDASSQIIYCVGHDWRPEIPEFESVHSWFSGDYESPALRVQRPPDP